MLSQLCIELQVANKMSRGHTAPNRSVQGTTNSTQLLPNMEYSRVQKEPAEVDDHVRPAVVLLEEGGRADEAVDVPVARGPGRSRSRPTLSLAGNTEPNVLICEREHAVRDGPASRPCGLHAADDLHTPWPPASPSTSRR